MLDSVLSFSLFGFLNSYTLSNRLDIAKMLLYCFVFVNKTEIGDIFLVKHLHKIKSNSFGFYLVNLVYFTYLELCFGNSSLGILRFDLNCPIL